MFNKTLLPNGLRVITVPMPAVKSVSALIMIEAGSRYETAKINGLSHFLEHMIFKGTKNRPSSLAISSLIDGIGGSFNAFTSKEYTGFYVKAESTHLPLVLDVLSDMLLNSLFNAEELNKERGVITEEINMYEDQPQALVGEYFEKLLYGETPLGQRVIGTKENIQRMTREQMTAYVNSMYHAGSMVVGVAGNLPTQEVVLRAWGEKYFGKVNQGEENKFETVKEIQNKPQTLVQFKKTDQAHLVVGTRAYDYNHPDRYVLSVLGTILGGNMSSRLFLEVREKRGLAYYVHADSEEFADAGYFAAAAGVKIADAAEAVKVILGVLGSVGNLGVTEEELRRAKDYARGKMALGMEDSYRVASFYTTQELLRHQIETPEEVLAKIEAVTREDIQRVAKDIFTNQKLNLAIIGPFAKEAEFEKILKI